jgi:S-adenosylmethionine hydrolase
MKRKPLITLLSDFGLRDPYVAEMKAVILSICPDASIVDVSHEIDKYDMRMGAYTLARAAPYFPKGTIHVAIVDPSVGTERRPMIVETKRSFYVGPDNGLLMLSAQKEGIVHVYEVTNRKYMLKTVSKTFHGRDVFSPAAAHLAKGVQASDFGPEVSNPIVPSFAQLLTLDREIRGEVIHIDGFGNIVTNVTEERLKAMGIREGVQLSVTLKDDDVLAKLCSAYGDVPADSPLTVIGSDGFLEVAVNRGNAAQTFETKTGDRVILKPPSE